MTENPSRPVPVECYDDPATYAATRLPVEEATTLIPDAYTAPAFHAFEQERIFARSWVPVAVADELASPGDFVVVEVAGASLIVCRDLAGDLRAHHNVCRHRGARLCIEERGHVKRFFQCPYHAWAYGLDGSCLGTPLFTPGAGIPEDQRGAFEMSGVRAFDKADFGLYPVRVASFGPIVFVCLDEGAPSLEHELGDLPERLHGYRLGEQRLLRRVDYEIDADWKLVAENFTEYYHLPWVHPGLVKVSPLDAHHRWQGDGMYVGFCTTPIAPNTDDGGWQGLPALGSLTGDDAISARFAWVFPSIAINALPNHTFLILARPASAGRTHESTYLLAHPEAIEAAPDLDRATNELLRFWDEVNREDIAIVERVQAGLTDPAYTGGRMCYRFEESVHRLHNMIVDRLLGVQHVPPGDGVTRRRMFAS